MTYTMTVPTGTETFSSSESGTTTLTLPTATESFSETESESHSATVSSSESITETESLTTTFVYFNNYTYAMSTTDFTEGQELRLRITSYFAADTVQAFNTTVMGTVEVRAFAHVAAIDCEAYVGDTASYPALFTTDRFGLSLADTGDPSDRYVAAAHVTVVAPTAGIRWVMCFKHTLPTGSPIRRDPYLEQWQLVTVPGSKRASAADTPQTVLEALPSVKWYRIPDPTASQYAIIHLLGDGEQDFILPPSTCGLSQTNPEKMLACGLGDNVKIVPAGEPCTYEHQNYDLPYYGSALVDDDGMWNISAIDAILEGATAGGVARLGPQFANPIVDQWTEPRSAHAANVDSNTGFTLNYYQAQRFHAYAYARLPDSVGSAYDVCYSSVLERRATINETRWEKGLLAENTTAISRPVWRKLYGCSDIADCRSSKNPYQTSFTVKEETLGWTMLDLSPSTWGTIRFQDKAGAHVLSNMPVTDPIHAGATKTVNSVVTTFQTSCTSCTKPTPPISGANYFWATGGDFFRLLPMSSFGEDQPRRKGPNHDPPLGSFANTGCWDTSYDTPATATSLGGMAHAGAAFPLASIDLEGDPTVALPTRDASGLAATYASLYVPTESTRWHVCYRRASTPNAGFRVLPWQHSTVDSKWQHLGTLYSPYAMPSPQPLIPSMYGEGVFQAADIKSSPPDVTWYMNDTRTLTYGPITIEATNATAAELLDRRPWAYDTTSHGTMLRYAVGSELRLAKAAGPCNSANFVNHPSYGAHSSNGGGQECYNAFAASNATLCAGSASDAQAQTTVSFYITVPEVSSSGYRVCFRQGAWNWRQVWPSDVYYRRQDWRPQAGDANVYPTANPVDAGTLSLLQLEQRGGMEALLIVTDTLSGLTASAFANDSTGDILRVVPAADACDINPVEWAKNGAATDVHLSLYCKQDSAGTEALSGLGDAVQPCGYQPETAHAYCGGRACPGAPSNRTAALRAMLARSPDVYDDIVPHDTTYASHTSLAAAVVLPVITEATAGTLYKTCFKQASLANWVVFNSSWEMLPPRPVALAFPASGGTLLAGELQRFTLRYAETIGDSRNVSRRPVAVRRFYAKLVPRAPPGAANDNCLNPAGSTEAEAGASYTNAHRMGATDQELEFRLVVPHSPGQHWLCVQAYFSPDDSLSWHRLPTPFTVVDNGVRWFVTPESLPVNQAGTTLSVMRCGRVPAANGVGPRCDPAGTKEILDTSPGKDAVKIVALTDACHGGQLPYREVADHGTSAHVALEGVIRRAGAVGADDLGPADGPADVAVAYMTMPPPPANLDTPTAYKVCVRTTHSVGGVRRATWVEARQARAYPTQRRLLDAFGRPALVTRPSIVSHWSLDPALRPTTVLVDPLVLVDAANAGAVGLAGASTLFVSGHDTANPGVHDQSGGSGFNFTLYDTAHKARFGAGAGNLFKLVQGMRALARYPPNNMNGTGWTWQHIAGASCAASPAVDTGSNAGGCTSSGEPGRCPSLSSVFENVNTKASFHLPLAAGAYMVCYRLSTDEPWLWLRHGETGSPFLFTQPSYLEFDGTAKSNVTVFDLRMASSPDGAEAAPLSSWCSANQAVGEGVPCFAQNAAGDPTSVQGFFTDLVSVIPDEQICTRPAKPTRYTDPPSGWHNLIRTGNATAGVWNTWDTLITRSFILPPANAVSAKGRYKVCLYKAGDARFGRTTDRIPDDGTVSKGGVVYQLYNRVLEIGYHVENVEVTKLEVTHREVFNASYRFMTHTKDTQLLYENVDPTFLREASGLMSYTPVYSSGVTIPLTVSASTSSGTIPFGNYPVWVEKCVMAKSWLDLSCTESLPGDDSSAFTLENTVGECTHDQSETYNWPRTGLQQFLTSGKGSFSLRYLSACTKDLSDNLFGCGIRFASVPTGQQVPVYSNPIWINIENHYPDELQLDGVETLSARGPLQPEKPYGCTESSPECYLKVCYTGEACTLRIQARYRGPVEYAAKGGLSLEYSQQDYLLWQGIPTSLAVGFQPGSWKEERGVKWKPGGFYEFVVTPKLVSSSASQYVYFNITYSLDSFLTPQASGVWVRCAILVTRRAPQEIRIVDVVPLDLHGLAGVAHSRPPVQLWHAAEQSAAFSRPAPRLAAYPGTYLEALYPYELLYDVCTNVTAADCHALPAVDTSPLGVWKLSATVVGQPQNKVLETMWSHQSGTLRFSENNLATTAAYTSNVLENVSPGNMGNGTRFRQWFRVLNNIGCSRFNNPPGCLIEFLFERGSEKLRVSLQTPVRVVAQTLRVRGAGGEALAPVASVTAGVTVSVYPGTPMGDLWLADEFHYGSVFAMIASPGPTDGVSNRDAVSLLKGAGAWVQGGRASCNSFETGAAAGVGRCLVWRYRLGAVGGAWGAEWTMRTTKPCHRCRFTFHSTWGAAQPAVGGDALADDVGAATLTFTDDVASLHCALDTLSAANGVMMAPGSTASDTFTITVRPQNADGTTVPWPRWWVFSDFLVDATVNGQPLLEPLLRKTAVVSSLVRVRMTESPDGAVAVFDQLIFEGAAPMAQETFVKVKLHSVGVVYDEAHEGAVQKGTVARDCAVDVILRSGTATPPSSLIRIVSVVGANKMCANAEGCTKWYSTTDTTTLLVNVWVYKQLPSGKSVLDDTDRNITAMIPAGSSAVPWQCLSRSGPCTTDAITLQSPYPDFNGKADGPTDTTHTYTYGSPSVKLVRARDAAGTSGAGGKGVITITQVQTPLRRAPVREANMSICATMQGSSTVVSGAAGWEGGNPCVTLTLWTVPPSSWTMQTAIMAASGNVQLEPGTADCGRNAEKVAFEALAYYPVQDDLKRYVVYHKPLEFTASTLALGQQVSNVLVSESDPTGTDTSVVRTNGVSRFAAIVDRLATVVSDKASFSMYGLEEKPAAVQIEVTASNLASPNEAIGSLTTTQSYSWVRSTMSPYSVWNVLDSVEYDEECPKKRKFSTTVLNYRSYQSVPGKGWSYTRHGGAVGVPFPVQTVVQTAMINGQPVSAAERAWTFKPSIVHARKREWSGCNDGGLLVVHQMRPSKRLGGTLLLPTSIEPAFVQPTIADAVVTNQGVATTWLEMTKPCQSCTLELNLCYTPATRVSDCFADPVNDANQSPPFAARTKLTKPFAIHNAQADTVHILDESAPATAADGSIGVGEYFRVSIEAVQTFHTWAMPVSSKFTVWVTAKWSHQHPSDVFDSTKMQYGNGGFLSSGLESKGLKCDVQAQDMQQATRHGASTSSATLRYFFTRPCSRCEVWYYYEIEGPVAGVPVVSGSFPQRQVHTGLGVLTVGGVTSYHVVTCAELWILAGLPPVSVGRRRPFSLTAWRVDSNGNPAWEGTDLARLRFNQVSSQGNGGGGVMTVSSPVDAQLQTQAAGGTATVRLSFSRACYACTVQFTVMSHQFTVLTDVHQVVLLPRHVGNLTQTLSAQQASAVWQFGVFAADDRGDRAFLAGGPTAFAWRRPYGTEGIIEPLHVSANAVAVETPLPGVTTIILNGKRTAFSLRGGTPTLLVTSGQSMHDGTTVDGAPGRLTLQVSGDPAPAFRPEILLDSVRRPTRLLSGAPSPVLKWTVPARRFVTTMPEFSTLQQGDVLTVGVQAIGYTPGVEMLNTTYYPSAADVSGGVLLRVDCAGACPECRFHLPQPSWANATVVEVASPLVNGRASFQISLLSIGGRQSAACLLNISAAAAATELRGADAQLSTLTVFPVDLFQWAFESSPTLRVSGLPTAPVVTASASANRTVDLVLQAWDKDFNPRAVVAGVQKTISPLLLITDPLGCFTCLDPECFPVVRGNVTVPPYRSQLAVRGHFAIVSNVTSVCVIRDILSLPPQTRVVQSLVVDVRRPSALRVRLPAVAPGVGTQGAPPLFARLDGRTADGTAAMLAGYPARLQVEVVDANGTRVVGDQATLVSLEGRRDSANRTETVSLQRPTRDGVADFLLDVGPTLAAACADAPGTPGGSAGAAATVDPTAAATRCAHHNWTFSAAAVFGVGAETQSAQLDGVGPLYVVRQADRLVVEINTRQPGDPTYADAWTALDPSTGLHEATALPAHHRYVWGYPFSLRVSAVDSYQPPPCSHYTAPQPCRACAGCSWQATQCTGTARYPQPLRSGDGGYSALCHLRPFGVPCAGFDVSPSPFAAATCTEGGPCRAAPPPLCETGDWVFQGARFTQQEEVRLWQGQHVVGPVAYTGLDGSVLDRLSRFSVSSHELHRAADAQAEGAGAEEPTAAPTFTFALLFQKISRFDLVGPGVACSGQGAAARCSLPTDVFPPLKRVFDAANPDAFFVFPRAPTATEFDLWVHVSDAKDVLVVGDSSTVLELSVRCIYGARAFSFGQLRGVDGNVVQQPAGWNLVTVSGGVGAFRGIGFGGLCSNASLTVRCNVTGHADTHQACRDMWMETAYFEVGDSTGPEATPLPTPPPVNTAGLPRLTFSLGAVELTGFGNAAKSALETAFLHELTALSARELQVYLRFACTLSAAEVAKGITAAHRADPTICKTWDRPANAWSLTQRSAGVLQGVSLCTVNCTSVVCIRLLIELSSLCCTFLLDSFTPSSRTG